MIAFIKDCWMGQERLWKAFWLGGLLAAGIGVVMALIALGAYVKLGDPILPVLFMGFLTLALPVNIWWHVSVWRCSPNTQKPIWESLAKGYVIVSAINWIFRAYDKLEKYVF